MSVEGEKVVDRKALLLQYTNSHDKNREVLEFAVLLEIRDSLKVIADATESMKHGVDEIDTEIKEVRSLLEKEN